MKLDALDNPAAAAYWPTNSDSIYNKTVKQHGSDAATEREAFSTAA